MSTISHTQNASISTDPASWEPFRVLLEAQRAECMKEAEFTSAALLADGPETVTLARSSMLERTLQDIYGALERIVLGTYGACVHCGSAIPVERLELRPYAAGCVSCSELR